MSSVHIPVLEKEIVELLSPALKSGVYIDATLGAGGHTKAILKANANCRAVGIDQDESILKIAKENLKDYANRTSFIQDNFRNINSIVREEKLENIQAILADIGMSSWQLDDTSRGFSFKADSPLDMRMDNNNPVTAELIIKTWDEKKLAQIFWQYGEERFANKIAHTIRQNRQTINTTKDLAELIEKIVPPRYRKGKIHPATRIFQALRIAVNDEIESLKEFVKRAPHLLALGGRLAIISFHSLEDRIVKQQFAQLHAEGNFNIITKHPIIAAEDEIKGNSRSRSAKLRVIERLSID